MEKDFLAGQGERKRITSIQFCSDSTLPATPEPKHPHPANGLGPVALAAPRELEMLETGGHRAPAAPVGLGLSPP